MPTPVSAISTTTDGGSPSARRAAIDRRPPPGIACSAFSMMLVSARANNVRSIVTVGSAGGASTVIVMRLARPVR